jgi:cytochrome c
MGALLIGACAASQSEADSPDDAVSESAEEVEPEQSEPAGSGADKPCLAETFQFDEVRAACDAGGARAAKKLMNQIVKRAKEAGNRLKCSSCHDNTKTYTLSDNAVDDLRALL